MPKKAADFEAQTIHFEFGEAGETTVAIAELPEAIIANLAVHGLSQKLGDSYASARKATEGTDIDPDEWCKGQVESVFGQLKEGNWTTRTPGAGGQATDLATALAEVGGIEVSDAIEKLSDASKEEKAALKKHPQIKVVLERIRAERAQAKADAAAKAAESADVPDLSEFLS
ncbi:MAG: hypothetical protein JSW47_17605 [Phycisphaerales bacterium]|nr:MAG: hypothetical protein JSW47_17605 [Phycisphaerales bacterium]